MQIIRGRIIYGSADWPTIKLRQLILAVKKEQATAHRNMLVAEQKAWRDEEKLKDYAKAIRESNDVLAALYEISALLRRWSWVRAQPNSAIWLRKSAEARWKPLSGRSSTIK